jgi:hypothetical protein
LLGKERKAKARSKGQGRRRISSQRDALDSVKGWQNKNKVRDSSGQTSLALSWPPTAQPFYASGVAYFCEEFTMDPLVSNYGVFSPRTPLPHFADFVIAFFSFIFCLKASDI